MRNYSFSQLKEDITYFFEKGLNMNNHSVIEAATYCFYTYEGMKETSTEFILYCLMIGSLMNKYGNKVYIGQYTLIKNAIDNVINSKVALNLSANEKEEVLFLANKLKNQISCMKIVYDPNEK